METERLLKTGELKKRCSEAVYCKCLTCGDSISSEVWESNGGCQSCGGDAYASSCGLCGGKFNKMPSGKMHDCMSVEQFQKTGFVAFSKLPSHDEDGGRVPPPRLPDPPAPKPVPKPVPKPSPELPVPDEEVDALYDEAVEIVLKSRRASISLVQRHLRIGYNRATRLIEQMKKAGIISPMRSNGNREVLAGHSADDERGPGPDESDESPESGESKEPKGSKTPRFSISWLLIGLFVALVYFSPAMFSKNTGKTRISQEVTPVVQPQAPQIQPRENKVIDKSKYAYLGVMYLVNSEKHWLTVNGLDPQGPAARYGVKIGDRVLTIGGKEVRSEADVTNALEKNKNASINFVFLRRYDEISLDIIPEILAEEDLQKRRKQILEGAITPRVVEPQHKDSEDAVTPGVVEPQPKVNDPEPVADPAQKSIDEQYDVRAEAECNKGFTGILCREALRLKLCEGKWSVNPPVGQSHCMKAASYNSD